MKKLSLVLLRLALAVTVIWIGFGQHPGGPGFKAVEFPLFIVVLFFAVAVTRGENRWICAAARLFLSYEFLHAVADRFGWLGAHGTPGVSWGDFTHFVSFTRLLNSFLPGSLAFPLAIAATIAETVLGLALLLGFRIRITAACSAVLLMLFAVAMTISLPIAYQFMYAVFVMATGSAVLATAQRSVLSYDALTGKRQTSG